MTHSLCDIPEAPETLSEVNKDPPAAAPAAAAATPNSQTLMERLKSLNRMVLLAIGMTTFVIVVMMIMGTVMFLKK
ncbi:hypothetical protein OESDEN_18354 [Oesophagostomum dentatum]|uniref:Uncharacterized protein n=1 Tax=Oesophagostomum dentatum TaxID=61180 RepID=A0A0B1SDI1_OESDE|nr:hypothetical protein OESDEN_18354 [Oesophagostomum dentatum]